MDRDERHELKQNDLQEFILNFREWWAQHGNTVLIVFIVIAVVFAVYRLYNYRTYTARETAWADLTGSTTPAGYMQVAESHGDPTVQALALLRAGDLWRQRAVLDQPAGEGEGALPPAEAMQQAVRAYERVLAVTDEPVYHANALLGLAAVAESQQQWDEAEAYYQQVVSLTEGLYPNLANQARRRQALLDELRQPVVFATEPPATATDAATDTEPPATQPAEATGTRLAPPATPDDAGTIIEGEVTVPADAALPADEPAPVTPGD